MKQFPLRIFLYLAIDCAILAVCLLHIPSLTQRATTPFEVEEHNNQPVVSRIIDARASGGIRRGDVVVRWRGDAITIPEALEFLSDFSSIGDSVLVTSQRGDKSQESFVTLIPFYPSSRYIIITFFVGIVIWGVGIYLLWNGWSDFAGRVLHWVMVGFASVVMLTWGAALPTIIEKVVRPYIFFVSYEAGIPLFFLFTTLYPRRKPGPLLMIFALIFIPGLTMLSASLYFYLGALRLHSVAYFTRFQSVYDVFHVALFFYIGGGILNLIHSHATAVTNEERQRTKWILWGFVVGAIPFLFLYILPQLLFSKYLIDEEYTTIFYLTIPFAFAVSFLKYRLFDIEVVINRSIVYSVLSLFIVAAYILTVLLFTSLIGGQMMFDQYLYVVGITLAVAFVFNPLRRWVQRLVDESLFTARTNYRAAMTTMTEHLHSVLSSEELFIAIVDSLKNIVPSETIAVYRVQNNLLSLEASIGTAPLETIMQTSDSIAALEAFSILALEEAISHSSESMSISQTLFLKKAGFSVCAPIKTGSNAVLGIVGLRPRSASEKYDENEIDFVVTLCSQSAEVLGRLLLQERIIFERDEKRRLEELNNLKSDFVSYVSHELRTPLTSVKMFSELLAPRLRPRDTKAREYVSIIEGESERLNRMVSNILDSARIDKGVKEYTFANLDLRDVVKSALESMKYQIRKNRFSLKIRVPKQKVTIHADADAVAQAVINLIVNAIKYSTKQKSIAVDIVKKNSAVLCRITDHGDGISKEALPHLFEKFYREPSQKGGVQGVGLGLPLVKHIMEAHGGRVDVHSVLGKGSSFTLVFPFRKKE